MWYIIVNVYYVCVFMCQFICYQNLSIYSFIDFMHSFIYRSPCHYRRDSILGTSQIFPAVHSIFPVSPHRFHCPGLLLAIHMLVSTNGGIQNGLFMENPINGMHWGYPHFRKFSYPHVPWYTSQQPRKCRDPFAVSALLAPVMLLGASKFLQPFRPSWSWQPWQPGPGMPWMCHCVCSPSGDHMSAWVCLLCVYNYIYIYI